jgi:hypothetical protein
MLDRESIRQCLARLSRGEDRRDPALISAEFRSGASVDYGIFAGSVNDYLGWVVPGSPDIVATQHVLGQSVIQLHSDTAHRIRAATNDRDTMIGGRYLDRLDKVDGHWRIARRTMRYDWIQDMGEAVDWSAGLMGMPLDTGRYTGHPVGGESP